jgi:hypothetical protein
LESIPNIYEKLKQVLQLCAPPILFPSHHPCNDVSKRKSLGGLSHHPVEEKTNTKKGITKKHAMLQHQKD